MKPRRKHTPTPRSRRTRAKGPTIDEIRRLQSSSVGYLLIRCGQLWNERGLAAVNAANAAAGAAGAAPVFREAHTRLLPFLLEEDGIRITDLARRVGVTKQAVHPLIADMAAIGAVRLDPDPADARARRVVLTDEGRATFIAGTNLLLAIESEISPHFTPRKLQQLLHLLQDLLPLLEPPRE